MTSLPAPMSRRRFVVAGLAVTCLGLPVRAQAPADQPRVIRARPATAMLRGGQQAASPVWAYGDTVPGPILRVKRGGELRVRIVNELPEATSLHWHGARLPDAVAGLRRIGQAVIPGASTEYQFRLPDAGTFWYHPAGNTARQTERGLRGALIVDEDVPVEVDQDLLLFFEDWSLAAAGSIEGPPRAEAVATVNGRPGLDLPVRANERIRLRVVNAASARVLVLRIEQHAARVMAIDGQPAEPFLAREGRLALGPGNRADLFVDATLAPGSRAAIMAQQPEVPVVRLLYGAEPFRPAPLPDPAALPGNALPSRIELRNAARYDLPFDALVRLPSAVEERPPLFSVKRGRTVALTGANRSEEIQAVHLHGHHFRLLDRLDDGWKPFWLDTVMIGARQTDRIAFVADNPGKWLIECQPVGATKPRTAAWFEVT